MVCHEFIIKADKVTTMSWYVFFFFIWHLLSNPMVVKL